ncbi:MAG: AtpZ/AtpI family protein [Thermoanaerobaculia bacterium]
MAEEPRSGGGWQGLSGIGGIGFELVAAVAGLTLIGYGWDRHFGSRPWGLLTGAILGLIGGMYNMIRRSLSAFKQDGDGGKTSDGDPKR